MATLEVEKREQTGKYAAFQLRAQGFLPGVLYAKGMENINLKIPLQEFEHLLQEGERVLDLQIGSQQQKAIIKEVQHGTFAHEVMHADFRAISETDTLTVTIRIELAGEAAGVQEEGAVVEQSLFDVEIECLPRHLPEKVEMDVSDMHNGDVLYVKDLPQLEGVKTLTDAEEAVVNCHMPQVEEEPEEPTAAEEAAAEPEVIGEKEREEAEAETPEGQAGKK